MERGMTFESISPENQKKTMVVRFVWGLSGRVDIWYYLCTFLLTVVVTKVGTQCPYLLTHSISDSWLERDCGDLRSPRQIALLRIRNLPYVPIVCHSQWIYENDVVKEQKVELKGYSLLSLRSYGT